MNRVDNPLVRSHSLVDGTVSAALLRQTRLEGYAYRHLAPDHPLRPSLKSAYLIQELRHHQIKSHLLPLVRAWQQEGVQALFFKGFALAEFVYASAGERFYGDVDVLVHPDQVEQAIGIAVRLGWLERWNHHDTIVSYTHEASHLHTPDGLVRLDLHVEVLQRHGPDWGRRIRFTGAVWQCALPQPWEDTQLWLMQPVDALLVGLLLNRCWGDRWGFKPSDLLDARVLCERFELSQTGLVQRAKELGCSKTLALLLERLNPWEDRVDIEPPTLGRRIGWELQTIGELGVWEFERRYTQLTHAPAILSDVLRQLPRIFQAKAVLRQPDLKQAVARLDHSLKAPASMRRCEQALRGIRWGLWLLGYRKDACLIRSLALFAALRAEGLEVAFVSGVRKIGERLQGHAWVEFQGLPIEGTGDEQAPALFRELFRYPGAR